MNQTCENDKKPNFGPDFGPVCPNFGLKNFSVIIMSTSSYVLLQAIILCNFKGNYRTKLEEMVKNVNSGPISLRLAQI